MHCVSTHDNGTIKTDALITDLQAMRAEGLIPFALVGTAGTTDHGAIDDLNSLATIAAENQLWFHVDGAYGGALF